MEHSNAALRYRDMTQGPEWRSILLFALPMMLAQLLQQLYATVDGIVIGNFGSSGGLAAVGNCAIVANVVISLSNGMGNGSAILVSQMFGAKKWAEMRRAASTAIFLMLVLGLASSVLVFTAAGFLAADILGIGEAAVAQTATVYIRIYAVGFIFTFLYNVVAAILRAVGDSRAVLYFLMVSTVMNVILDLLFVAVFRWDVAGAALATVLSQLVCVLVSVRYMHRHYQALRFRPKELRPTRKELQLCLRTGLPSTLQQLVVSCGDLLIQRLVNSFGQATMNAWTVSHRYDQYCCITAISVMQSMASFSGQNAGANRYDRIKRGLRSAVVMDLAMVALVGGALYAFASPLAQLFGLEGDALSQAVECMRFFPLIYPIFAFYVPFYGMYIGCGNPGASAVGCLMALSVRVVSSYALVYLFSGTHSVIWHTFALDWSTSLLFVLIYYRCGRWKSKRLVENDPADSQKQASG